MQKNAFRYAQKQKKSIISLDIEASLDIRYRPKKEKMLSLSVARRADSKIQVKNFIRNSKGSEFEEILEPFGKYCMRRTRPLVIVGYNIISFDLPVLMEKLELWNKRLKSMGNNDKNYWCLRDAFGKAYVIDIMWAVREEMHKDSGRSAQRLPSLEEAIRYFSSRPNHPDFKNTKGILDEAARRCGELCKSDKWEVIKYLWRKEQKNFKDYIEGDAHDTLLLAEMLFGEGKQD